jgi:hypothetical protein
MAHLFTIVCGYLQSADIICRYYLQILSADICRYLQISAIYLQISGHASRYLVTPADIVT